MNAPAGLDALGLSVRAPDLSFLREIYRAFSSQVPFESASKIVRDRQVEDLADKPRRPGTFWKDFEELGAGGTCFARVAAFEELLRQLGFSSKLLLGEIRSPESHAALLVTLDDTDWLVDAGYPLPDILPFEPADLETPRGHLRMALSGDSATIVFASGPEAGRRIRFDRRAVTRQQFEAAWRRTFSPDSIFLTDVILRREIEGRVLRFHRGEVQILDASSRTRVPLLEQRSRKLAEIFGIEEELLSGALDRTGDPDPPSRAARVEVFREGDDSARMLEFLATPEGYRRFARGLGSVEIHPTGARSFEARITPERGEPATELVRFDPDRSALTIDRDFGLKRTGFEIETTDLGPRLVRYGELPDAREEFLRSDLGRSRIAAVLAMDLAALSRL